ncbi:MAG: beta-galactosidase [Dorea sp.]|nr:beta-galactosidase [Dorea sp.]
MKTDKIYFGAAYYDEYLPYDRIDQDMKMMKKAGMNVIRIAESTWSTLEPQEGIYDFSHLDRMLDAASQYGLDVIVGTPTYAIPTWLAKKSEDILALTEDGQEIYGRRQNMDLTSPVYLKYAENIIRVLLEHVHQHPRVIGYQIDNETHHYHTAGPRAQAMFVDTLKDQYPDIQDFNHEFGLDYWSNRVNDWSDFPDVRGTINGSLAAEFEKFQRKLVTDFHHWQASIIEEYRRPDQFITHNFDFEWHGYSLGLQPDANSYDSAACMTVVGGDIYHPSQSKLTGAEITACGNILRGLKRDNYLILETQAQGNIEWLPYPGQLRLCAYSHLANGANSVMYWHWHSIHNAIESYWKGVLSHDFSENATYCEAMKIGDELQTFGDRLKNLQKKNDVAILLDHESLTGLKQFPVGSLGAAGYNTIVRWIGDALYRANIEYDMIYTQDMHLDEYKLVFVPALYSASEDTLNRLAQYAADGGHLVVTFRSGFADEHIKIYSDTQPHILHQCLGINYNQFTIPEDVSLDCHFDTAASGAGVHEWMDLVMPDTAVSLADYHHTSWNRYAAVTENRYGAGTAYYLGCYFDTDALDSLISYIARNASIECSNTRFPVIIKKGINDYRHMVWYYLNYSSEIQTVTYKGGPGHQLLDNTDVQSEEELTLHPWDLIIIEEK